MPSYLINSVEIVCSFFPERAQENIACFTSLSVFHIAN